MSTKQTSRRRPMMPLTVWGIAVAGVITVVVMQSGSPAQVAAPISIDYTLTSGRLEFLPSGPADCAAAPVCLTGQTASTGVVTAAALAVLADGGAFSD